MAILRKSLSERPITELMAAVGRKDRTKFRNQILRPMMDAGWIETTVLDTPLPAASCRPAKLAAVRSASPPAEATPSAASGFRCYVRTPLLWLAVLRRSSKYRRNTSFSG
ncbi:Fic family protein [Candidatus Palauibacter sp.]|uniref:Fic family protein n=1 Tax=Candidatus Palauibacter sp. TaxID=3101350 RepID=UPI003B591BDF